MRKILCDRCGKDITDKSSEVLFMIETVSHKAEPRDVCQSCFEFINSLFNKENIKNEPF